ARRPSEPKWHGRWFVLGQRYREHSIQTEGALSDASDRIPVCGYLGGLRGDDLLFRVIAGLFGAVADPSGERAERRLRCVPDLRVPSRGDAAPPSPGVGPLV